MTHQRLAQTTEAEPRNMKFWKRAPFGEQFLT